MKCLPGCTCRRHLRTEEEKRRRGYNYWGGLILARYEKILQPAGYVREHHLQWGRSRGQHYNLDFAHVEAKVNIEIDGPFHDARNNEVRDARIRSLGWKIIRIMEA